MLYDTQRHRRAGLQEGLAQKTNSERRFVETVYRDVREVYVWRQ